MSVNGLFVHQGDTINVCRTNSLTYVSFGAVTSTNWQFHLGTPSTAAVAAPPPIQYNTNGIDSTILTITDASGTTTMSIIIKVTDIKPVVDFTFNNNLCSGSSTQFNSSVSSGVPPYTYAWAFGDGGTSTAPNPSHTYTSLGCGTANFNATLTVTDATGCASTVVTHSVSVKQAPLVQLQDPDPNSPFSNCENSPTPGNATFVLTVNNISPSSACITSYNINWGDGNSQTGLTNASFPLNHTYTTIGAFSLTITAFGGNGCNHDTTYIVANQTNPAGSLGTLGTTTNLCAPATVPFTIDNWQLNSVGTTYTLNFGDGQQITLNHPLNPGFTQDTIFHTYTTTSCPAANFVATLTVSNACGTTPYTAGGIKVLIKPTASFNITPNPGCVNQSICFTNTSQLGAGINCATNPSGTWDFGDGSPAVTGTSPCHTYSSPGTYTVTLTMTNFCGSSVATKQVCITAPPVPGFTVDNATGCIPLAVAATNTTTDGATCGAATYLWSVAYTAGFCGVSSSFSFTNGTTNTSLNPSFVFNNPGTYTITLRVTNTCGSFTTTKTIIVTKPPTVSINAISNVCGTASISPVAVVSACSPNTPTYLWTFQGGTPATSTSLNPGVVVFSGAGVHNISLDVTNECGTVSASRQFTIDTVTTADAGPGQNMCGSTATMAANAAVIGNGLWTRVSGPNIPTITTPTSPTTTITGLIAGTYVFRWTITSGTCTSSSTVTIIIAAGATPAAAGPDQNLCLATSATLAANNPTVGTGAWSYVSGPAGYTITDPLLPNTTVTGLVQGVYTFRWTTSFSTCTPSTDDVQISIFDNPTTSDAGVDQTICSSTATMAGNTALTGTGSWSLVSGPNIPAISIPSSPATAITGLIPGTYVFRWRISNGACPPSDDNVQVIVTAVSTTAAAGPDQVVCAATSVTLAGNTAVVGTGTWTYVSGPAGYTITNPASPTTTVTGLVPGTYVFRWTISNGICPATSDDVQIIINDNVTVANAGPAQNMCGTTATMAANTAVVGNGLWSYVSGPLGSVITTPSSPNTTITSLVPGTYVFKWTITNGSCVSSSNVTIIIAAGATAAAAGADQNLCLATSSTLNGNTPVTGTGTWSIVSAPNVPTITTPGSPGTTVTGLIPGIYVFRWTISFSTCTPTTDDIQITVFDNPTVAAAGIDQTICSATATMAGNTAAVGSGVWTRVSGPNIPVITTPSSATTTITGLIPGTYVFKWKISNGVCPPSEDDVQVIVTAVATTAAAGADQILCAATNTALAGNTAVVGTGAWSYVSGPAGYNITNPALPNTTVTGLVPGTYVFRWTITNGVCPPSTDDVQLTVLNALQNQVSAAITTICSGQSVTITGATPTGGTGTYNYGWEQSPDGVTNWTPAPLGNGQSLTITLTSTTYFRRKVSSLPCETYSNIIMITVQASVANNNINANQSICINTAASTINGSTPTGGNAVYSYQWQQSTDGGITWIDIPGATAINYNPGILTQTTQYRRTVSTALCSGPQANNSTPVIITVNQDSKAQFTASATTRCAPFNLANVITVTPYPDRNGLYQWYADGVLFGSNSTGVFPGYTIATAGTTVIIKLVTSSQFGCKKDSMFIQFVTVTTSVAKFTRTPGNGCGPLTVAFTNTSSLINPGIQFFWNFGNGITSNLAQPGSIVFNTSPFFNDTTYYVTLKAYNGCDTTTWRDSVKVRANPKARFGVDTTFGCSPFTAHFTNTSLGGPSTYYWDFGDGRKDTTYTLTNFFLDYHVAVTDTFTIRLIAKNECKSDTTYLDIVVAPNTIHPQISLPGNQLFGCAPHTAVFNNSTTGGTNFIWNFGDGSPLVNTSATQNLVPHTYTNPGLFPVSVRIQNGCSDTTVYLQVEVFAKPIAGFTTNGTLFCAGDTVRFSNTSQNANSYRWDFGDGTGFSSLTNPTHTYATGGTYTITLFADKVIASGIVCSSTQQQTITITNKPQAIIVSNVAAINCIPFTLNVSDPNLGNETVRWEITDTTTTPSLFVFSTPSAQHVYTKPGTFTAKLVLTNAAGCKDSVTITFTVRNKPVAAFAPLNLSTCKPDTIITHINNSTYSGIDPLTYRWLVDNSQVGISPNLTYHYLLASTPPPRTFNTWLIVSNSIGCSDTARGTVIMQEPPKSQFSFINPNTCVPFALQVTNSSTGAASYKWLLNGVQVSTAAVPTFNITQASALQTIMLITDNAFGCKPDTLTKTFTTLAKPTSKFTVSDTLSCTGSLNVAMNNQSTGANNYTWIWSDGSPNSNFINPTHLYNALGTFPIILIASDGICRDTSTIPVKIATKPVVNFSANKVIDCGAMAVSFTNLSTNAISYLWDLGDGTLSTATNPFKLYQPRATAYTVKLVATGTYGCKDSLVKPNYIFAKLPPSASFMVSPSNIIAVPNYSFSFINTTPQSNNYKYFWNFGDFSLPATTRDASHRYQDTGRYLVSLGVFDSASNCTDTAYQFVQITGFPGYLYVPNAFQPNSLQPILKTFLPLGRGLAKYRLQIFTTWGQKIFESTKLNAAGSPVEGWNGLYNGGDSFNQGKQVQQDNYMWRIDATFLNGTEWEGMKYPDQAQPKRVGTITLVR